MKVLLGLVFAALLGAVITLSVLYAQEKSEVQVEAKEDLQRYDVIYVGYPSPDVIDALSGTAGSFKHGSPYLIGINLYTNSVRLVDTGFLVKTIPVENLDRDLQNGKYIEFSVKLLGHETSHEVRFIPHETLQTATLEVNPQTVVPTLRVDMKLLEVEDMHRFLVALREI